MAFEMMSVWTELGLESAWLQKQQQQRQHNSNNVKHFYWSSANAVLDNLYKEIVSFSESK